jgi:peptide/nickel transport system substrate-binding protein/dipeptide transport system substrate-binding protein
VKAKALLKEAGVAGYHHQSLGDDRAARLQPECADVGADDPAGLGQDRDQGQHRQLRMGRIHQARQKWRTRRDDLWLDGDNGDPDNWLGVLYSCAAVKGSNYAKWCDPAYDKLIQQAKVSTDKAQRVKLYQQAQLILKQQVPITPIANSTVFQPLRKEVSDFKISPFGLTPFYGVGINK